MTLPDSLQQKILEKIECEISQQIKELRAENGQRHPNFGTKILRWLGDNAVGIGTLIAVFTLIFNVYKGEIERTASKQLELARLEQIERQRQEAQVFEVQQRREERFFALIETTSYLVKNVPNDNYGIVLSNLIELRYLVINEKKHGGSLVLLSMSILTSDELMGTTLYTMAAHSFASEMEQISKIDFDIIFSDWKRFWDGIYSRRSTLNLENDELTIISCALGYTQIRLYNVGPDAVKNCWPRERVFRTD